MKTRKARNPLIDALMNETILYGGIPLRRSDAYTDALWATKSHRAAEEFAFGFRTRPTTEEPWTLEKFRRLCRANEYP